MRKRLKQALWDASPALFNIVTRPRRGQMFSIGIYEGRSPFTLASHPEIANPILTRESITDVPAAFVADPFMVRHRDAWHVFFEILNEATRLGQIGVATSSNGRDWRYAKTVLVEPFHLAYPHVFSANGEFYMVPDTPDQGVLMYKAVDFPQRWQRTHTLLSGGRFSDSSIFQHGGSWWMLTAWSLGRSNLKSLRLYYADEPTGPWREHPQSPVLEPNESGSRPAGRVVVNDGHPVRFAQDGFPKYGSRVRAFEILELSRLRYVERELNGRPVLQGSGNGWNAHGMHHVDAHEIGDDTWFACVDGWYSTP